MTSNFDIVVIGAGIAGTSAAAELAEHAHVGLMEMEAQPGFHATGRSAAFFAASYGNNVVRGITAASEHFYRNPPNGFTNAELIRPRDTLFIARRDQATKLAEMKSNIPGLCELSAEETCTQVPILDSTYLAGALRDESGGDLDVDAILQAYLRLFRQRGGELMCNLAVEDVSYRHGSWKLATRTQSISAPIVVNAAGAWAGSLAEQAGLTDLGLQPMKRTALLINLAQQCGAVQIDNLSIWPLVVDVDEEFYFKPDAGKLLLSPADETSCGPCDARPDELDIAIAVDRFQKATSLNVQSISHRWAGLRTFAPDRHFVVGFDPRAQGFFWLAGQGGYGVQSAPGMAQLSRAIITNSTPAAEFSAVLDYQGEVVPERLLTA